MLQKIFAIALITFLGVSQLAFAKGKNPPFLILNGIPHLTGLVKAHWDDTKLNLTSQQKEKLLKIRQSTMGQVMKIKKSLAPLESAVATKILSGSKPDVFKAELDKIASLKTEATKVHLECVYATKKVLSAQQYSYLIQ